MTRHVLLLNSDKPEVVDALTARPDVALRVITRAAYADRYPGHEVVRVDSLHDLEQVSQAAYGLARTGPIDHVVAGTEKSVPAAGLVRSLLGLPGPGLDESLWASHKRAMKDRLRSAGLPVTDFAQVATVEEIPRAARATGWPVVAKLVFGAGSAHTHRISSAEEFVRSHAAGHFADLAGRRLPVLVERFVKIIDEYHCDGVVRAGRVRLAAPSRYFAPPLQVRGASHGSHFLDPGDPLAAAIVALHAEVVRALRVRDAVTHLEVFDTPDGLVVGEVAIRPGGRGIARCWRHAHGVDLWDELVRAALGEPSRAGLRRPDRVFARAQLPSRPGLREWAAALPEVLETRPARWDGGDVVEVFFTAADAAGVRARYREMVGVVSGTGALPA